MAQKIRLATLGNAYARGILIRDWREQRGHDWWIVVGRRQVERHAPQEPGVVDNSSRVMLLENDNGILLLI